MLAPASAVEMPFLRFALWLRPASRSLLLVIISPVCLPHGNLLRGPFSLVGLVRRHIRGVHSIGRARTLGRRGGFECVHYLASFLPNTFTCLDYDRVLPLTLQDFSWHILSRVDNPSRRRPHSHPSTAAVPLLTPSGHFLLRFPPPDVF